MLRRVGGLGGDDNVHGNLQIWSMLRLFRGLGVGGVGWGGVMITFLELANVVDATQEVEWGGVG